MNAIVYTFKKVAMYSKNSVALSDMDYLDVKNLAQTGEGAFLEFKRTVPSAEKIAREISAFANTRGGTVLIGVDDDKSLVGVDGYQEEQFLLNKATRELCIPQVDVIIELVQFGVRDIMVVKVPEANEKPVYIRGAKGDTVYIREADQSKAVSRERIQLLLNKQSDRGVTFEYGANEQKLFRYLNEYNEISVAKFAHIINNNEQRAGKILVNLVSAGILRLFTKDNIDYFAFSRRCKS